MRILHLDYETRSEVDISDVGLENYCRHPSTKPILLGWAFDDDEVQVWSTLRETMPEPLREAFQNPDEYLFYAWQSSFERWITKFGLGISIAIERWRDPSVKAKMLSMPGGLEDVGNILNIPADKRKIDGGKLIGLFCLPYRMGGEETLYGTRPTEYHDYDDRPREWQELIEYNKQDVVAERYIGKRLESFPLSDDLLQQWFADQHINDTGMPVDIDLCRNARTMAVAQHEALLTDIAGISKLANPNSRDQLLPWLKQHGYSFESLSKVFVSRALSGESRLDEDCRKVLLLRQESSKTSFTKYENILQKVGPDSRIRDQFTFLGAARTGRWASIGLNLQNLARPEKYISDNLDEIVYLLRKGDISTLTNKYPKVMEIAAGCLRPVFRAPEGKKLVVCDLGSVENRGLGWLAGCQAILDVFEKGLDSYIDFATRLYHIPYAEVTRDQRQVSKVPVLGCGYGMGGGTDTTDRFGNPTRSGLYGYAQQLRIPMTEEQAHEAVRVYRSEFPEVPKMWYGLNDAAIATMYDGKPHDYNLLTLQAFGGYDFADRKMLRMVLPSGRCLYYIRPKVEKKEFYGRARKVITYEGMDSFLHIWARLTPKPAIWTENGTQAVCRDLLAHGMMLAQKEGFEIVGHCHDELITLLPEDSSIGLKELRECMIQNPYWSAGFPLDADGYETLEYYHK